MSQEIAKQRAIEDAGKPGTTEANNPYTPGTEPHSVWLDWFRRMRAPRGTPISELSGRPGEKGYAEFCRIAESWGY